MKKIYVYLVFAVLVFAMTSCGTKKESNKETNSITQGGTESNNNGETKKIVIYCGGSSEYSVVKGSAEDEVIDAIEKKYLEDTGISLEFDVAYLGSNMGGKLAQSLSSGEQVDIAISHTRYDSGIDDYALGQNVYYDLSNLIDEYGNNIAEKTNLKTLTTFNEEIIGIPSYVNPYKFGILVRKDYMKACGYTDNQEEAKQNKELTYLSTIEQFQDMCVKMKSKDVTKLKNDSAYSVSGAIWDIEKVFTGAFSNAGYFGYQEILNADGEIEKVIPGFGTEEYFKLLKMEYDWVKNYKILSPNTNTTALDASEGEFISGKTGVFVTDPTVTHLIRVARKAKINNPNAEFTIIGPLGTEENPERRGFIRATTGYKAAIILKNSKVAKEIVQFVNWMYGDAANYNLCRYGIEGEHWVNNNDGTYSYPEGKEEYLTKMPYSGIVALVENENMSNLLYSQYTAEEKQWINNSKNPDYYVKNDVIDYILPRNTGMSQLHSANLNNYYNCAAVPAWYGSLDPYGELEGTTRADYALQEYLEGDEEYIQFVTRQYKLMKLVGEL